MQVYGLNAVTHQFLHPDGDLLVVGEPFYTLQGEGPQAGWPAIFVRLAKCNLRCFFCDTSFEEGNSYCLDTLVEQVGTMASEHKCGLVVLTGGEPLLQNVVPFIRKMNFINIAVAIETAGTVFVEGLDRLFRPGHLDNFEDNLIVCSPKTPNINARLRPLIGAFKYIIRDYPIGAFKHGVSIDGLPVLSTQKDGLLSLIFRQDEACLHPMPIYLQAMDERDSIATARNVKLTARLCLEHGYRNSMQTHKLLGLD
jgi:organic radical activating enzyme